MLALIAGTGALPAAIVAAVSEPIVLCQMAGFKIEGLPDTPKTEFRIETLGTLLETLKAKGVTRVCFAGAITRPDIDPNAIDAATLPLLPHIQAAIAAGDDGALRAVIGIFEGAGLSVVAAHELAPELLCAKDVLIGDDVNDTLLQDIETAQIAHKDMSAGDIGQALVVAKGRVVAQETRAGTDALLATLDPNTTQGGTLYKAPKSFQDRRADLPVIGPQTVELAAKAGITSIVIEAMGVMVLDKPRTFDLAKTHNIRIWSREAYA